MSKVNGRFKNSVIAIGHTRWATHGGVTEVNAHPHSSADGLMSVVHNGIIENTSELLSEINESGYSMTSETDTELIVHLLHEALGEQRTPEAALEAFQTVIGRLEGAWAIAVIVSGMDGILVAKNGAPLVIGRCENCISISSDPLPLYGSCSEVAYLDDGDIAYVSQQKVDVISESADLTFAPHQGDYSPGGSRRIRTYDDQRDSRSAHSVSERNSRACFSGWDECNALRVRTRLQRT